MILLLSMNSAKHQEIEDIRTAPVLHDTVCETEDMQKTVEKILGL